MTHNSKELVASAFECEEVERVPFCVPFQGCWALQNCGVTLQESIKRPDIAAAANERVAVDCRMDGIEAIWDWLIPVEVMGCIVKTPEYGTISTFTHIISGTEDLDLIEVPDVSDFRANARFSSALESAKILNDHLGKKIFLGHSCCSPFTLAGELRGVESMMIECYVEPDFIHSLVRKATDILKVYSQDILEAGLDVSCLCDPMVSGHLVSADDYLRYGHAYIKEMLSMFKESGGYTCLHICGDTSDRIEDILQTGADIFSVDQIMDVKKALKLSDGRMAILGNIDPVNVLLHSDPATVKKRTHELLEQCGKKGFILGAGCDLPTGTPYENVEAISEAVYEF